MGIFRCDFYYLVSLYQVFLTALGCSLLANRTGDQRTNRTTADCGTGNAASGSSSTDTAGKQACTSGSSGTGSAQGSTSNRAGHHDEQDCLLDNPNIKGVYCLVSPCSFSCANLVPASLKGEPKVTIMGKTSGGGACVVQTLSTADGNTFNLSGSTRLNTIKNGTLYSVDEGVTPDVYIDNMEHLYNRQYLVDMLNRLN